MHCISLLSCLMFLAVVQYARVVRKVWSIYGIEIALEYWYWKETSTQHITTYCSGTLYPVYGHYNSLLKNAKYLHHIFISSYKTIIAASGICYSISWEAIQIFMKRINRTFGVRTKWGSRSVLLSFCCIRTPCWHYRSYIIIISK